MAGIDDKNLAKIAEEIGDDDNLSTLGQNLGFREAKISQYVKTNRVDGGVGSKGTRNMLFDWKKKTKKADQVADLTKALEDANLGGIAEEFLPSQGPAQPPATGGQSSVAGGAASGKNKSDEVTGKQLVKLSKLLHADHYSTFCTELGIDYSIYSGIKQRHQLNFPDAYEEVLQKWKSGGGTQTQLDEALREAGAAGLIEKYKEYETGIL